MQKYVPEGSTKLLGKPIIIGNKIVYNQPYARYLYYGKKMVMPNGKSAYYSKHYGFWSKPGEKKLLTDIDLNYHTEGTGSYWDKKMVTAEMPDILKEVKEYIKKRGNN